jgi:hypothetical protein
MNSAYKHLDSKLRIAELTIGQWVGVLVGLGLAIGWGVYVSPFGPTITLTSSVYLAALPAGAVLVGSFTELDPARLIRSAIAWRRLEGRFTPGPGRSASGYVVIGDSQREASRRQQDSASELELAALWEAGR